MVSRRKRLDGQRVILFVIQSLLPEERKTGTLLLQDIAPKKHLVEKCTFELRDVSTGAELKNVFDEMRRLVHNGAIIFIHFEAHGDEAGMQLSSGELIGWEWINDELRRINVLMENSLIIMLAMCYGGWIVSRIDIWKRAPFRLVISSMGTVGDRNLQMAFSAFYDRYFFTFNHRSAMVAMNEHLDSEEKRFHFLIAEHFFDQFIDRFHPDFELDFREKMMIDLHASNKVFRLQPLAQFRKMYYDYIAAEHAEQKKNRDYFTMLDLRTGRRLRHPPRRPGSSMD